MQENDLDNTRERILEVAGQVFAEKGFENATVREICQQADANVAAINYHFGDKKQLFIEAVKRAHAWKMARAVLPKWPSDVPAEAKLADFIVTFVRRMLTRGGDTWHGKLLLRELHQPDTACAEVVRDSIRPEFELLLSILRELRPEATAEQLHLISFSIVGQCLHYWFADPVVRKLLSPDEYATYDAEKLSQHIIEFSLTALGCSVPSLLADAQRGTA